MRNRRRAAAGLSAGLVTLSLLGGLVAVALSDAGASGPLENALNRARNAGSYHFRTEVKEMTAAEFAAAPKAAKK